MVTSFKRSHACTTTLSAPNSAAGHHRATPLLETPGHSPASVGQSLVVSLLLSPGYWCAQGSICTCQESVSPVLCKFWKLYGGVNDDLLQEDLSHIHTQSPSPCGSPLLTVLRQETLKHSCGSVSVGFLGPGVHKVCLSPPSISVGMESESEVAQLCPSLWDPMDCSLPGSSVHGIFQGRVLELVAISFSRGSSRLRD